MATREKNNKNLFDFGYKGKSLLDELMPVSDNNDLMCILRYNKSIYVYEKTHCTITCKKKRRRQLEKDKKRVYSKMDAENPRERRKNSCSLRH